MSKKPKSARGRKPSIGTATAQVQSLRRSLKSLVTETKRIEAKLSDLDSYYSKQAKAAPSTRGGSKTSRGRGPNIRDIAAEVLERKKKPMPIADLAAAVMKRKKGEPGSYFTQNLGIALRNDKRFKRAGRGTYGLR